MAVHHSIARPSDAVEMQFAALRNCYRDLEVLSDKHQRDVTRFTAMRLPSAATYFWSKDCLEAVWASSLGVPSDATIEDDLSPPGGAFWWFDKPLPIDRPRSEGMVEGICAIHIIKEETLFVLTHFSELIGYGPIISGGSKGFDVGTTLFEIQADSAADDKYGPPKSDGDPLWRFAMAAQAWLRQKIAVQSEATIERHCRKRITKEFQAEPSGLHVVQLRRSESAQSSTDGSPAEWSCQWLVRGHWRNQPYKAGKRLIFIAPYIKGPEDKPLKAPTTTVFSVSR